jgi:hypothetical protein
MRTSSQYRRVAGGGSLVEEGSNSYTVPLRVVGGDEKGTSVPGV